MANSLSHLGTGLALLVLLLFYYLTTIKLLIYSAMKFFCTFTIGALLLCSACGHGGHDGHEGHGHDEHEEAEAHAGHDEHGEHEGHDHAGLTVFTHEQIKAGGVEIAPVKMHPMAGVIRTSGEVITAQDDVRTISATAAGVVSFTRSGLTQGTPVGAGQSLFHIRAEGIPTVDNTAPLRADLANAEAALARQKELYKEQLITRAEYEDAVAAVAAARAALSTPQKQVINSGRGAASPISGYIAQLLVSPGQYVEVGTPLATVTTNRRVQLRADVPRKYADVMNRITTANVVVPGRDQEPLQLSRYGGRIVSRGNTAMGTGYIPMLIEFDNPGTLATGTPVEAYLLTETRGEALVLPRTALTEEEGLYFVYVEVEPEHFRKTQVKPGESDGVNVEILSGLTGGEKVVVKGSTLLKLAANSGKAPQGHTHNH